MEPKMDLADGKIKNVRAVVWRGEGEARRFLLTEEHEGYFTIPGGCKDENDADLLSALHRELHEELNLVPGDYMVRKMDFQKEYEHLYDKHPASERFGKITQISLFAIYNLTKEPTACNEIRALVWADQNEALGKLTAPHMKELLLAALAEKQ